MRSRGTDHVFQDEIPAYDESQKLADGDVRVDVRATRFRHPRGELSVTKRRQNGGQTGYEEADGHAGSGHVVRDRSRQHVNPGTDHVTHTWKSPMRISHTCSLT